MSYRVFKNTKLAQARLTARVRRHDAAQKAAAEKEPQEATGTMMTQIDCPECSSVFDLEGDRDGETVHCTECNVRLIIRRH